MPEVVKPERNYGVDALRIVSMFMIVLLHVTGQGGVLGAVKEGTGQFNTAWLIEISAYGAVNCYALISGYVGFGSNYRYSRLFKVWLQTAAYCLVVTLAFSVFVPSVVKTYNWVSCFLPITCNLYWYITAYFGMFFLVPFLESGINNLNKRQLGLFILAALLFYMLMPCLTSAEGLLPSPEKADFGFNFGYSTLWLSVLYIVGGAVKKYELGKAVGTIPALAVYVLSVIISWYLKLLGISSFFSYSSPFAFLSALPLLLIFSRLKIHGERLCKLITRLSSATLGVYILHTHPLIWSGFISGISVGCAEYSSLILCLSLLGISLSVFLAFSAIDFIRQWIFKLIRVDALTRKIDKLIPWQQI